MLALYVAQPVALQRLDLKIYDALLPLRKLSQPSAVPVIIDIDEQSLARYGQWPWPRYLVADLVDRLTQSGVASIGLDIMATARALNPNINKADSDRLLDSLEKRYEHWQIHGKVRSGLLYDSNATFGPASTSMGYPLVTVSCISVGQPIAEHGAERIAHGRNEDRQALGHLATTCFNHCRLQTAGQLLGWSTSSMAGRPATISLVLTDTVTSRPVRLRM